MTNKKLILAYTIMVMITLANFAHTANKTIAPEDKTEKAIELMNYVWQGNNNKAKESIKQGTSISYRNEDGWSVLFHAIDQGNIEITKILIDKGAYVNAKTKEGNTPLMLAVAKGNFDLVRMLVNRGATIQEKNNYGKTALSLSQKKGNIPITQYLQSKITIPAIKTIEVYKENEKSKKITTIIEEKSASIPAANNKDQHNAKALNDAIPKVTAFKTELQNDDLLNKKTINLSLNQVKITQILNIFAAQGNFNMLIDKMVTGNVSFSAKNIPIMEALDIILKINGYTWTKKNNTIIVSYRKHTKTFLLNYIKAENAKKYISELMPNVMGISVNNDLNAISVMGNMLDIEEVTKVIESIDNRPEQVMVEARVIEVSAGENPFSAIGYQYKKNENNSASLKGLASQASDANSDKGFYAMIMKDEMKAWLQTLQTNIYTNLLANTKILATNNKPAKIITGQKLGYRVRQITNSSTIESVEFLTVGTQLEFTPQISKEKYINMIIKPKVSEGQINDSLPQENTTEVQTELTVKDGQSIVIGGLIRNKKVKTLSGIPILMSLPFIGNLFQSSDIKDEKKETIIIITPHIIDENLNISEYKEEKK
ncbi:MAG: hypothetical protein DKM50_01315 [Candidatus Margulisiibacteriota bacterium]|nr:MAG: hypothetical protein DKM50_01315 [Candidatus Margulisiibacteriota bacterium]HCY36772.1 hypothetical protein [Candidatus Margulisiibacteriota bacterium]